jgi:hypothetical protein
LLQPQQHLAVDSEATFSIAAPLVVEIKLRSGGAIEHKLSLDNNEKTNLMTKRRATRLHSVVEARRRNRSQITDFINRSTPFTNATPLRDR